MGIMAKPMVAHHQKLPSFSVLPSSLSDFNGARLHAQVQVPHSSLFYLYFLFWVSFFTLKF